MGFYLEEIKWRFFLIFLKILIKDSFYLKHYLLFNYNINVS